MLYWLDTEFCEDGETIDLISIGIVAEDGREFYACSQEARLDRVSPWVRQHVLPSLPAYGDPAWLTRAKIAEGLRLFTGEAVQCFPDGGGDLNMMIVPGVPLDTKMKVFGYYADYDWVVLCQLFGTMMNLPKHFPKYCLDLKQLSVDVGSPQHPPDSEGEHNALIDARWNRDLYSFLMARKAANEKAALQELQAKLLADIRHTGVAAVTLE